MADDDLLVEGKEAFDLAEEHESENRKRWTDDVNFAGRNMQWPEKIRQVRQTANRPCLTVNRLKSMSKQVINEFRQNKPSIKVYPADDKADKDTARIISGLLRHIEYASDADVAYTTAATGATIGNVGYFCIDVDYAHDDTFDLDIMVDRVVNPMLIYGDPYSTAADSSDWDNAFEVEMMPSDRFEREWKGAEKVDWETGDYSKLEAPWRQGKTVMVAKWWRRDKIEKPIYLLSDGTVVDEQRLQDPDILEAISLGLEVVGQRAVRSHRVQRITMTGAEVLEEEDWVGRYIPIVPVYGEEIWVDNERYLESLIHPAIDAQRMFNYWRTTSTELVALAPRVPFIGPKGAFKTDNAKWQTINSENHAYIEYDGEVAPQRQPLNSEIAVGAMQEAMAANDDMKSIMNLYDPSLGRQSNETSGRAIIARQRQGETATFHFADNMARAIKHAGRIMLDLIPHVYNKPRILRILGEDGRQEDVQANKPFPAMDQRGRPQMGPDNKPIIKMHDLTLGKYDLTVQTGPSFATRRQEAAESMTEVIRVYPQSAPVIAPLLAKNLDWPGADEVAERFEALVPPQAKGGLPPELDKMIKDGMKRIQQLEQENQALKADKSVDLAKIAVDQKKVAVDELKVQAEIAQLRGDGSQAAETQIKLMETAIEEFNAQTKRIEAEAKANAENNKAMAEAAKVNYGTEMAAALEQVTSRLEQLRAMESAETVIVRDADNRVIGARKVVNGAAETPDA